ncbi:MAG: acyl-ACP--UDP-N-acetylglucosamine O-acyltransferase [Cyanobacteria bacterium P01_H01_bin.74]
MVNSSVSENLTLPEPLHVGIHPTAIVDPRAALHPSVTVGPYSVIHRDCTIGENTVINAHVVIEPYTQLGKNCVVSSGAVLGGLPQDLKFENKPSYVVVGDETIIREFATIHRSSKAGGQTTVGKKCMLMAYSHIAHDCTIGDEVIIANSAQLAGHVTLSDGVFLGGATCVHQGVTIGRYAILGGVSATRQDVPPFAIADGRPAHIAGVNRIALKRRGFSPESRNRIKQAFQLIWFSNLNYKESVEKVEQTLPQDENITELLAFVKNSKRGIHRPPNGKTSKQVIADSLLDRSDNKL